MDKENFAGEHLNQQQPPPPPPARYQELKQPYNRIGDPEHFTKKNQILTSKMSDPSTLKSIRAPEKNQTSFEAHLEASATDYMQSDDLKQKWKRPPLLMLNEHVDSVVFQQIEIDDYISFQRIPSFSYTGVPSEFTNLPVIRMYGCTENGNSVVCNIHGFFPYFYVPAPINFNQNLVKEFEATLSRAIDQTSPSVISVGIVTKKNIYGYSGQESHMFLKITVSQQKYLSKARGILESGAFSMRGYSSMAQQPFESNIAYTLRFMIDCQVTGANWIEIPPTKWVRRFKNKQSSTAQLEIDVMYNDIISHAPEDEWSKIAPLRVLSFDIECAGRKGIFPDHNVDSVIQIANMVTIQGHSKPFVRNIFTLKECGQIVGSHIMSHEDEGELLKSWGEFFRDIDPDIVTGYNINNFDWPYLLGRAQVMGVTSFPFFGRIADTKTQAKDTRFSSKAYGTRENKEITLDGRLQLDMIQVIQRDYKLRSYSLNSVCAHFLGEQKEDVPHTIITDLQNGDPQTRRRLAVYCLKDAYLPQRLLDKLMVVINYMEMARVTGVPFNYLLTRGQQIKVISQLYRKALKENLVIPALKVDGADEPYTGATVIKPDRGFYKEPIATLDFSSLYPSIMMAHNLCYSTLLMDNHIIEILKLKKDTDYIVTPSGHKFVKPHLMKGILPTILDDLLSARKRAKSDLKKETDPFRKAVLDGRQLALKISANSVYGFTGATVGKLPCLEVSQSVTAFGREMIELTKHHVEEHFCIKNNYEHNAKVIYGDTDSVMVKFGTEKLEEAMRLGKEAAQLITSKFIRPINLEFEKVYYPYLLINKKRYAGLYYTKPDKWDKMDTKGIETVRRDNCRLVQTVVETCLRKILIDRDVDGAILFAKQTISELLLNKVDLSQLVITKALSKSGEEYASKQAHVELAERMRKRDPGSAPALGDRVAYVIVKAAKGSAAYERVEDPIYVLDNNIPIDTKYYLENQLKNPLLRIFGPIIRNDKRFGPIIRDSNDENDDAEDKRTESALFTHDHTRAIQISAPTTGGLMKFAVKRMACMGCKAVLKDQNAVVCPYCLPKITPIYLKHLQQHNEIEARYSRLWTQCQRCQGSLHQDVLCTSKDCPIFYMRKKVQKVASDSSAVLQRFGDGFRGWSETLEDVDEKVENRLEW